MSPRQVQQRHGPRRPTQPPYTPQHQARNPEQSQHRGSHARPSPRKHHSAFAPRRQHVRPQANTHSLALQEQLFAEAHPRRQVADSRLSCQNLIHRRSSQQPRSQRLLARARARGAQQLKQRCNAKQVQVARVRMRRIQEPLSRLAAPRPPVFQPRHPKLVKLYGSPAQTQTPDQLLLQHRQHDEYGHRRRQHFDIGRKTE